MKRILLLSLLLSSLVLADKIAIPMPASSLAIENSGTLSAIDAYQDGVGIYTVEQIGSAVIDNSEMNGLVYKYGAEAKMAEVNIKDYIISSGNATEKVLAGELGKFKPITPGNGTVCDDKNTSTINDKYVNGICSGTIINRSCLDILNNGLSTGNGLYIIDIDGGVGKGTNLSVYCDMVTDGGGWTVIQRRTSLSDFYKNWTNYKNGFGDKSSNFWLGNDNINKLTSVKSTKLRIDMKYKTNYYYAEYNNFSIDNEINKYKLLVSGYTGNAGDSFSQHNGYKFSTYDQDNDTSPNGNCSSIYNGAWWYSACHSSNLNGLYLNGNHLSYANGINWYTLSTHYYSLEFTEMKIR